MGMGIGIAPPAPSPPGSKTSASERPPGRAPGGTTKKPGDAAPEPTPEPISDGEPTPEPISEPPSGPRGPPPPPPPPPRAVCAYETPLGVCARRLGLERKMTSDEVGGGGGEFEGVGSSRQADPRGAGAGRNGARRGGEENIFTFTRGGRGRRGDVKGTPAGPARGRSSRVSNRVFQSRVGSGRSFASVGARSAGARPAPCPAPPRGGADAPGSRRGTRARGRFGGRGKAAWRSPRVPRRATPEAARDEAERAADLSRDPRGVAGASKNAGKIKRARTGEVARAPRTSRSRRRRSGRRRWPAVPPWRRRGGAPGRPWSRLRPGLPRAKPRVTNPAAPREAGRAQTGSEHPARCSGVSALRLLRPRANARAASDRVAASARARESRVRPRASEGVDASARERRRRAVG